MRGSRSIAHGVKRPLGLWRGARDAPRMEMPTRPPSNSSRARRASSAHGAESARSETSSRRSPLPRTLTLPEKERGIWLAQAAGLVTALQEYNGLKEHPFPKTCRRLVIGSQPDCDIVIAGPYVSGHHCRIERKGRRLFVYDEGRSHQGSHNGTFYEGYDQAEFELGIGKMFVAGNQAFLTMTDAMRAHRPTFVDVIGAGTTPSPDDLLVVALQANPEGNVLITGPAGCDHERLAHSFHTVSLRHTRELVAVNTVPATPTEQRALIDRATRATMLLTLPPGATRMDPRFSGLVLAPHFRIRLIVLAASVTDAITALGTEVIGRQICHVPLRPLAARSTEILTLLEREFVAQAASIRVADLTTPNAEALQAYGWPDNFNELRMVASRLDAIARAGSQLYATGVLNLTKSSLNRWTRKLGLAEPLFYGR